MKQMQIIDNPGIFAQISYLKSHSFYIPLITLFLFFLSSCNQEKVKVYCIGDSTMSQYNLKDMDERYGGPDFPRRGWAMALSAYLNEKAEVSNLAVSGRSSKSFRAEGHWEKVRKEIQEGDFIVIQFGHNDEKSDDPKRFTAPFGTFKENLIQYAKESKALGAHPIMATPIARRRFNTEGLLTDTHGDYVTASREAAKEAGVPLIDLNKMSMEYLSNMGVEESKALFLHLKPGSYENLPDGMTDDTHLSKQGACAISEMFIEGVANSTSGLKKYLLKNKPDCYSKIK